jgi:formylglycine-generating enzyme required for sulfatase activity
MKNIGKLTWLMNLALLILPFSGYSQTLYDIGIEKSSGLSSDRIILTDSSSIILPFSKHIYSFILNTRSYNSGETEAFKMNNLYTQIFEKKLTVTFQISSRYASGLSVDLTFENTGTDTVSISNVVPFGEDTSSVYITGKGPSDLARAWLFRPGFQPVRVILPDDAWEMGYSSFPVGNGYSVCSVARRSNIEGGQRQRYLTLLPPKAKVNYSIHAEIFKGEWQNGLRKMFRDRYLFDLESFDNTLYQRNDLAWIKDSYLIILQMAWDREFFDRLTGKYTYAEVLKKGIQLFGNIDVYGIWPTWPRLGLDQRNQWDLYRDLPGSIQQLRNLVKVSQISGTRFFISYNPWDNSTRKEDHYKGMAKLIAETEADGVVLDTRGSSNIELQTAADSVRRGVVMYSEGMAIPKDMPGIISGRVHNAIFLSPELNLNKLIKPDFSIFRVCDVGENIIHREIAIAFFNGYGTELNLFRPGGRDEDYNNDLSYLARTTFILRQNNDAFLDNDWTPLIQTTLDKVFVNRWKSGDKTVYTVLNMRPEGVNGKLFEIDSAKRKHYISLWNHENLIPITDKGKVFLSADASGWQASFSNTRKEGSVDCIAELPDLIKSELVGDSIKISGSGLTRLIIWKGDPSYQTFNREFTIRNDTTIRVKDIFGYYEGKIVLQLIENKRLKDENILQLKGGKPWIISKSNRTKKASNIPADMVLVPGTNFSFNVNASDDFIPYPEVNDLISSVDSFLIDKYPVTNAQYYDFLSNSGYRPADTTRYLRNWESGVFRQGQEMYPVVYLSYEDMQAYSKWAQKRLPTQAEWQLAAQGQDKRKWPWGDEFHGTYCNNAFDRPTPVDAFSKGQSPYGVFDLVGNVWQMTNDMYFNGTNYFTVIRGGSYYKPESSWWYIQGGPQQLDKTQILLLVSPGFDRSPTLGFRCVRDIDSRSFKKKERSR